MNDENSERIAVAVLAKAPLPGLAKTRLIPLLGEAGAAALQRWLLHRAVATAVVADVGPVVLWCAPDTQHADFDRCRAFGAVSLRRQPDGDLGRRMRAAIDESPTRAGTLVIGTDCPLLTPGLLRRAADSLREQDAVVMPAEDGGYVLIGMRKAASPVFDGIEWGSRHVMAQTRQALDATFRPWVELDTLWDVDRDEDFARLARLVPDVLEFELAELTPRNGEPT